VRESKCLRRRGGRFGVAVGAIFIVTLLKIDPYATAASKTKNAKTTQTKTVITKAAKPAAPKTTLTSASDLNITYGSGGQSEYKRRAAYPGELRMLPVRYSPDRGSFFEGAFAKVDLKDPVSGGSVTALDGAEGVVVLVENNSQLATQFSGQVGIAQIEITPSTLSTSIGRARILPKVSLDCSSVYEGTASYGTPPAYLLNQNARLGPFTGSPLRFLIVEQPADVIEKRNNDGSLQLMVDRTWTWDLHFVEEAAIPLKADGSQEIRYDPYLDQHTKREAEYRTPQEVNCWKVTGTTQFSVSVLVSLNEGVSWERSSAGISREVLAGTKLGTIKYVFKDGSTAKLLLVSGYLPKMTRTQLETALRP
jgi:hypothetical protein